MNDFSIEHISVMTNLINKNHRLTLDHLGILLGDYERNVGKHDLFKKWISEIAKKSRIYFCDHKVAGSIANNLIKCGLHETEDHHLVGLALHSDNYIISEDSDFGVGCDERANEHKLVYKYLTSIGLKVQTAPDANLYLLSN